MIDSELPSYDAEGLGRYVRAIEAKATEYLRTNFPGEEPGEIVVAGYRTFVTQGQREVAFITGIGTEPYKNLSLNDFVLVLEEVKSHCQLEGHPINVRGCNINYESGHNKPESDKDIPIRLTYSLEPDKKPFSIK